MSAGAEHAGSPAGGGRQDVPDLVRTSCAAPPTAKPGDEDFTEYLARLRRIELMLKAIAEATPLDAERRSADDLLLVLAFRRCCYMVFRMDHTVAEDHLRNLCRLLHIEKLADGTMLGNDTAGPGPGPAAAPTGG